jgi:nucleoid DNA-binding protein
MLKKDLVKQLAQEEELSERKAHTLVEAVFDILTKALMHGEKIKISGFGTFLVVKRKGRKIRDPRSHKIIKINDYVIPHFRAGEPLKAKVREAMAEKKDSVK